MQSMGHSMPEALDGITAREMSALVCKAVGYAPPAKHAIECCTKCGSARVDGAEFCPACSTSRTETASWDVEVFHICDLSDTVKSMVRDPEIAAALLDHCSGLALPSSCSLTSERYLHWRRFLDGTCSDHPHHAVLLLHHDSFSPFGTRADDYSVGYLLLRPRVAPARAAKRSFVRIWVVTNGPRHLKTLAPILGVLTWLGV